MLIWIQVAVGGAIGALARYGVSVLLPRNEMNAFPWATFGVNVLGCLLIGFIHSWLSQNAQWIQFRPLLIVGVLGGFTTFSSFGLETFQLIEAKAWKESILYFTGTNLAGLIALTIGIYAIK